MIKATERLTERERNRGGGAKIMKKGLQAFFNQI
jgi:hypothetical protein